MSKEKSLIILGFFSVGICLAVKILTALPTAGQIISPNHQSSSIANTSRLREGLQIDFKSPPGQGEPRESDLAGTRGNCGLFHPKVNTDLQNQLPLTPLVPVTSDRRIYPALTVSANPTLFIFVPRTSATTAAFSLYQDETGSKELYAITVPLTNTPGIIKINLPSNSPNSLAIGRRHLWAFSIICSGNPDLADSAANPTVFGLIERTEISPYLLDSLEPIPSINNALVYAQNGIWYDTLMTLVSLIESEPNNRTYQQIWQDLLKSAPVNLKNIAEQPLVDCCAESQPY